MIDTLTLYCTVLKPISYVDTTYSCLSHSMIESTRLTQLHPNIRFILIISVSNMFIIIIIIRSMALSSL